MRTAAIRVGAVLASFGQELCLHFSIRVLSSRMAPKTSTCSSPGTGSSQTNKWWSPSLPPSLSLVGGARNLLIAILLPEQEVPRPPSEVGQAGLPAPPLHQGRHSLQQVTPPLRSHLQTLMIYEHGFYQNHYTFTCKVLIKIGCVGIFLDPNL